MRLKPDVPQPPSAPACFPTLCSTSKTCPGAFSLAGLHTPPPDQCQFAAGTPTTGADTVPGAASIREPVAPLPPWAGKQGGDKALTLPPSFCSTFQPLPVFMGRLGVFVWVGGSGRLSLEVPPVLVMGGWRGDVADSGAWGRSCSHTHTPRAAEVGDPHYCLLLGSGHLLVSPPALRALA